MRCLAALALLPIVCGQDSAGPGRQLRLQRLAYQYAGAIRVTGDVFTGGLDGLPITFEVSVRGSGRQGPTASALGGIRGAHANWKAEVLLKADAIQAAQAGPLILSAQVSCGGLTSVNEIELRLPGMPERAPQALRILSTTQQHNVVFSKPVYSSPGGSPGGVQTTPVLPVAAISALVEADSLAGVPLEFTLRLGRRDGSPVMASRAGPPGYSDPEGRFQSLTQSAIPDGGTRWDPLIGRIPYSALDLPTTAAQPLVLRIHLSAGPLRAYSEEDFSVPAPTNRWVVPR